MSSLTISTNIAGLSAHRSLKVISEKGEKAAGRLSSGYRINSSADDAAGLAISEKMRAQIMGLRKASENVEDANNLFATGDGALNELAEMAGRIRELAINAMNDTNESDDRQKMDEEVKQLIEEFDAVCDKTEFNTFKILRGKIETFTIENAVASNGVMESAAQEAIVTSLQSTYATTSSGLLQNVMNPVCDGVTYKINLEQELLKHDPDFFKFLNSEMYEADGTITDANKERFRSVLEKALNSAIRNPISKSGTSGTGVTPDVIVDYSASGKLLIATEQGLLFNVYQNGCTPAYSGSFGHSFLHMNFNSSSEVLSISRKRYDTKELFVQMGANVNQGKLFTWNSCSADQAKLAGVSVATRGLAEDALRAADFAVDYVVDIRTRFGSFMNRLEHTEKNLDIAAENLCGAESRIRDADMAKEMMEYTKSNIVSQAGIAMLAQANQSQRNVLPILQ